MDSARPLAHRPLARFKVSIETRPIDVDPADFDQGESDALRSWAEKVGLGFDPRYQSGPSDRSVDQLARKLLGARVDLESARGLATLEAMRETRFLHPFALDTMNVLARDFGTRHLARTSFVYNGHATEAMFPLFPTLNALGLKRGAMISAPNSGSGAMNRILQLQLTRGEHIVREEATRDHRTDRERSDRAAMAKIRQLAEAAAKTGDMSAPKWNGEILVIDKGGLVASNLDDRMRTLIRKGIVRFLVHNRDDVAALASLADEAYMIDISSSAMKGIEAQIIGQQYALLGAREEKSKMRSEDAHRFVIGAGLIGSNIISGLRDAGCPPDRITVIERDPVQRTKVPALLGGAQCEVRDPSDPIGERPERAIVYIATPGCGFDGSSVHKYGRRSLVLSATSGGKGVDIDSIRDVSWSETSSGRLGASGRRLNFPGIFADRSFLAHAPDGTITNLTMILEGHPLNLFEESWPDRYGITSAVVAVATAEAAALDRPGLHPMNPERQDELVKAFIARGLLAIRPLDPPVLTKTPFRVLRLG
jgi:hypothetical protein